MFQLMPRMKDGFSNWCKPCSNEYRRKWYELNKDHVHKRDSKYRANNKEMFSNATRKWQKENVERIKIMRKQWELKNKGKIAFYTRSRKSAKIQRTPKWSNQKLIQKIYDFSAYLGSEFHVDHIVPLKGKMVCGLHTECNLQVIQAKENLKKHNKLIDGCFTPTINTLAFQDFLSLQGNLYDTV